MGSSRPNPLRGTWAAPRVGPSRTRAGALGRARGWDAAAPGAPEGPACPAALGVGAGGGAEPDAVGPAGPEREEDAL